MAVQTATFEKTIRTLLDEKKYQTVKDILVTMEPADIAAVFDDFGEERMALLFRLLPKETAAETFAELESEIQETLIRGFSDRELHELVNELYVDDAADLVDEMPANVVKRILAQADPQMRKEINEILRYPENSAGSIMTTEYVSLRPNMTVAEAITRIRRTGVDKETIYTCYVTEGRKLLGAGDHLHLLRHGGAKAPRRGLRQGPASRRRRRRARLVADGRERYLREHPDRPGRGRDDALEIQLPGAARRGHGRAHGRYRDLRRCDGRSRRRDHGGHREDGRYAPLGEDLSALDALGPVQAPHPLAGPADDLGHLHGPDHHEL